jgi:DNA polymerase III psi subunit
MGIDNIQLSPLLLQQLYQKSLVDFSDKKEVIPAPNETTLIVNKLGNNEKNILVVVHEKDAAFLIDAELALLVGILTACQLSLADIALVNFNKNPEINFNNLSQHFNPSTILLFGTEPSLLDFPLLFPHFQLTKYNGQTYLSSPSLKQIANDVSLKKQLWLQLQKHFLR